MAHPFAEVPFVSDDDRAGVARLGRGLVRRTVVDDDHRRRVRGRAPHDVRDVRFFVEGRDQRAERDHRSISRTSAGRDTIDATRQQLSVTIETMPNTCSGP